MIGQADFLVVVKIAVGEAEFVDQVVLPPADKQPLAARRKAQAVKGRRQDHAGDDAAVRQIDDHHRVRPVARVQHGGPTALRVQRHVDRKVADLDLPAAGRSDHWLGSSTAPPGWAPGSFRASSRASASALPSARAGSGEKAKIARLNRQPNSRIRCDTIGQTRKKNYLEPGELSPLGDTRN